jgi:NADPH:quinone reductase-like Zn-dependent oxidoreductase
LVSFLAQINKNDLRYLGELLETSKIRPVIDKTYPLSQTAEAVRYVLDGHARGKVVINII